VLKKPPAVGTGSVADVLARHLHHARSFYPASSREPVHFARLATVVDRVCGELPAANFDCAALQQVRAVMMSGAWLTDGEIDVRTKKRQPIGWCRKNANRMTTRLRTVWRWAEANQLVPRGAWAHLRALPPVPKHDATARNTPRRRPATWDQVKAVLPLLPPIVAAMLEVQWWTGMRPGEVVEMRTDRIVRDDAHANNGGGGEHGGSSGAGVWHYRLAHHKNDWRESAGDGEQLVVLGPECQRVLAPYVSAAKNRSVYIFPPSRVRQHACYTTAAYGRAIARACAAGGIAHFTPYQIRHAAKTRITRAAGLDAARAVLRQRSIQAADHYGDARDLELAETVAKRIG
jgi:integrase